MVTIHLVSQPETSNFSLNLLSSNFTQSTRSIQFSVNIFHFFHHYLYSRLEYHDLALKPWHLYLSATNKPATLTPQQNPYPNPPSSKSLSALWRPSVCWPLLLSSHIPLPTSVLFFFFFEAGRVVFFWLYRTTCRILAPDQGSNLCPLQWKLRVPTTGPPGKSLSTCFMLQQSWTTHNSFKLQVPVPTGHTVPPDSPLWTCLLFRSVLTHM